MLRGSAPDRTPFRTAIALRTQAHNDLRLALNSDDRVVQEKYLDAARNILAEMEVAIERDKVSQLADASNSQGERDPEDDNDSGGRSDADSEHESEGDDNHEEGEDEDEDGEYEEDDAGEGAGDHSDEDRQWGEEEAERSEEEQWDLNNGENDNNPPATKDHFETHYFTTGPGMPAIMKDAAKGKHNLAANNLNIRVYARLMELFEIESRHRLNMCNSDYVSREKAARESPDD